MNQKLADHINGTAVVKRLIDQSLAYAEKNKTHIAFAMGKTIPLQTTEDLVRALTETDDDEYILTDLTKEAEQREIAEQVLLNTMLIWLPRIGIDMKQFVEQDR